MDSQFRVEMLGRFSVGQGSREITRFRTQKTAALLAYLAFYSPRTHPRDVLFELFWPSSELEAARTNLSVALNALRKQLEPPGVPTGAVLVADRSQVHLNPIAFTTDVEDFEKALREAETEAETAPPATLWMAAVDLYRGDLLPGYYEDWIFSERDRLRNAYLGALRQVVKETAEARQYEAAIEYGHRMVQADPLREGAYRNLMRLYMAVGRPEEALNQYEECERLLQKAGQATLSAATRELAEQLRAQQGTWSATGEKRTSKTQSETPVSVKKREEKPQAPSHLPSDIRRVVHRIPLQFTRYFGQEEAMSRLMESLLPHQAAREAEEGDHASSRLITLTGPGGTGKTRLAIEMAGRVKEAFSGGVQFISLADVYDPLRIGEVVRDVLELPRQPDPSALEQVIAFLNDQECPCLLLLDNFEQIAAGGASVVWTLLNRVPHLHFLVTSRNPLSLPGEQVFPVSPLPTPSLQTTASAPSLLTTQLLTYPSAALFVDRAQSARPEFQLTPRNAEAIAAICEKLEGIPLAIELAAARSNALTPTQILERLSERFELLASRRGDKGERHRSLWAAIDWSYHLLPLELQKFFARLSVFRGGWSLEAAESVCDFRPPGDFEPQSSDEEQNTFPFENRKSKIENHQALDYLSQLRTHSLILAEESSHTIRFRMLETLREFAAEQLTETEREETERRHAAYFHAWVTSAEAVGPKRAEWYDRFEEDLDNLRAVLTWSLQSGENVETGMQLAIPLFGLWEARGHFSEGRRWYARLLEQAGETQTVAKCRTLYCAGSLAYHQGDFQAARLLLKQCIIAAQVVGEEARIGSANEVLGNIAYRQGDYEEARLCYNTALTLARARGAAISIASALGNLANVAQSSGDFATSRALNEESLQIRREQGDRFGEARTLHNLANLVHSQGHLEEARNYYEQAIAIKRELADRYNLSASLTNIAGVTTEQGDYAAAATYLQEGLILAREMDVRMHLVSIGYMQAELVRRLGELEISARISAAMERIREEMDYPLTPVDQAEYERIQAELRDSLGAAVYEAARAEGRRLSLEEALAILEETLASKSL